MVRLRTMCLVLAMLAATGCRTVEPPSASPHYVLGRPYAAGGIWFYPREDYDLDDTGLATIINNDHAPLTSDGEVFDQTALAGAHPTLQLPAIVRVTNLENGRQVTVRLNDRGTSDPHRVVALTRRAAVLLGVAGPGNIRPGDTGAGSSGAGVSSSVVFRVRVQILPGESRAAADELPDAPRLMMTTAPREMVVVAELPPLDLPPRSMSDAGGTAAAVPLPSAASLPSVGSPPSAASAEHAPSVIPPLRLPELVLQTSVRPTRLMVHLDTFSEFHFAAVQQAKMRAAGARIVASTDGHVHRFRVEIGPLRDVSNADSVLNMAFKHGIPDARIVID